ncbi:MAG: carotenoid biosynthesis protein [Candidatus Rokubacteria bacterium]|nr:carotenoid biosynthesis protein [Candidatus Rokubacteria bacterium]
MWADLTAVLLEAWGTIVLRPYVLAFLIPFLVMGSRDVGPARTLALLVWGWGVSFLAVFSSTRTGIPFGDYHYTGLTAGQELFVSNIPFFEPLSFPFIAYAAWCVARCTRPRLGPTATAALGALLMLLLDIVMDPMAVRGDRWFLGDLFAYHSPGDYFGVPVSNFAGWLLVGAIILAGFVWGPLRRGRVGLGSPAPGAALYYGILLFSLGITVAIEEYLLAALGASLHAVTAAWLWSRRADAPAPSRRHPRQAALGLAREVQKR